MRKLAAMKRHFQSRPFLGHLIATPNFKIKSA
jgi:hypothetical protein